MYVTTTCLKIRYEIFKIYRMFKKIEIINITENIKNIVDTNNIVSNYNFKNTGCCL